MTSVRGPRAEGPRPDPGGAAPADGNPSPTPGSAVKSVRGQLLVALTLVAALVATPSIYTLFRLDTIADIAGDLRSQYARSSVVLGTLQGSLAKLDRSVRAFVATGEPALADDWNEVYRTAVEAAAQLEAAGFAESTRPVRAALDSLAAGLPRIEISVREGRLQEATEILEGLKPLMGQERALSAIALAIDRESLKTVERAEAASRSTAASLLISLVVTLALAAIVALWMTKKVSAPLGQLEFATGRVSEGQFELPRDLPYGRSDEIGSLARAFRRMTHRLSELERLRAEFMAAVTHDLKNPINVIIGYAQMLGDGVYGEANDRQVDASRRIGEHAQSLAEQIDHLGNLSHMEAGGFRIDPAPVEIEQLLTRVERSFRALADQRGIRFTVGVSGAPPRLTADADRLVYQVLGNLLGNAFKFTEPGGEVSLTAAPAQLNETEPVRKAIRIVVRDTGEGIPQTELPHIFDRYYRGDSRTRDGTGLGLAIARQVVEAHGGIMTVTSQVGEGTTFNVILPVEGPHA